MTNKFLVIVRAGDKSLHQEWTSDAQSRTWDLIVNYYGDEPDKYKSGDATVIRSKSYKFPALHELITTNIDLIDRYDYIFLPDDDLLMSQSGISRLFETAKNNNLSLCQPSLSWDSHYSWRICLNNPEFIFRRTNFVEVMAPCFKKEFLLNILYTFKESYSGWGLDLLWPTLISNNGCAIVDAAIMKHTRPAGNGELYKTLTKDKVTPSEDLANIIKKYNINTKNNNHLRNYGGTDLGGTYTNHREYRPDIEKSTLRKIQFYFKLYCGLRKQPCNQITKSLRIIIFSLLRT